MKLVKSKFKIRCEMGGCKNYSDYVLYMDRCGIHSSVYICGDCVKSLKEAIERSGEETACPEEENLPPREIIDDNFENVYGGSVLSDASAEQRDAAPTWKTVNKRKKAVERNKPEKTDAGEGSGE